jgi:hypothetical protein
MSKVPNYRITNLHSFEEATKQPRQIAGLYFYKILDCLVDFAYKISADFRRRPELYRDLGDSSIVATLAKLNAQYGTEVALPSGQQRAEIYAPIFGRNDNDSFPRLTVDLIRACTAYAERVVDSSIEMLRENVRAAHRPFQDYLTTLQGDSVRLSKEVIFSELTEKISYPVLRNSAVAAVFGVAKGPSPEYPYATDPSEDLLMEGVSIQLKSAGSSFTSFSRERISNLQRTALRGTEAIATVIDFSESGASGTDTALELLISKCFTWGTALASLKTQSNASSTQGQQPQQNASSKPQRATTSSSAMAIGTRRPIAMPRR